jgi:hypothetical protein
VSSSPIADSVKTLQIVPIAHSSSLPMSATLSPHRSDEKGSHAHASPAPRRNPLPPHPIHSLNQHSILQRRFLTEARDSPE